MAWQNRLLEEVYPVVYLDAIHYSVREDGLIRKLAAYVILGITLEGKKEVLSIQIGENETSKYWLSVLNGLKNRGVKDILILCCDGLSGFTYHRRSIFLYLQTFFHSLTSIAAMPSSLPSRISSPPD